MHAQEAECEISGLDRLGPEKGSGKIVMGLAYVNPAFI
jgi:hypothetical protein